MSTPITTRPVPAADELARVTRSANLPSVLPGLAFAVVLAVAAKGVALATAGAVSAILAAIVLGALWRNVARLGGWADAGVEFAGSTLLVTGIALIGLRLTLGVLAGVSLTAVPVVIACVVVALVATMVFGRMLGVT